MFKIFKDANEKYLEKISFLVNQINGWEKETSSLSQEEFPLKTNLLKERFKKGESLDDLLPQAFSLVREASKRVLNQRHYDAQLIGGIALHQGRIAEMKTGEGKTLAATLSVYLNALTGKGVHVITVNDYLARRDVVWMGQIYHYLGLTVGCVNHEQSFLYSPDFKKQEQDSTRDELGGFKIVEDFLEPCSRKQAYQADITYGTNNEFGFDYLRDNMAYSLERQNQRGFYYAVIDEVDSILIDEARTPLIISAPDTESSIIYKEASRIIPSLKSGEDYEVFEKERTVTLTEVGIEKVEKILGLENIYEEKGVKYLRYLEQALRAQAVVPSTNRNLFEKDRHYIVKDNQIIIIDESTGRQMPGRRWSGGLHQAIEAKEGVFVQPESKTLASVTFQNLFKMYQKLSGMTGTAATSAEEFDKVYGLEVVIVPTNKPIIRKDLRDLVYKTNKGKFKAIVQEIKERHQLNQPVLVGTTSIEKNELLSKFLEIEGIEHEKLNAKNHQREGEIIAQAGRLKAVTVATNMAGRGVDIILGGNPFNSQEAQEVISLGGLHVIGTERHEARRIDNQLRGRAGRQGDPGSSQFFVSLEDDLLRIFGGERIASMMNYLKVPEDQAIEANMISGVIESAQGKIEGLHFDARKHLLDYDNVANKHREAVYKKRNEILKKNDQELREFALGIVKNQEEFFEKEKEVGQDKMAQVIKMTALRILDSLWVEHLYNLEELRDSVKLRAYGQKDPLIEYKNEGHRAFHELLHLFQENFSEMILKFKLVAPSPMEKEGKEYVSKKALAGAKKVKIGRNDPCFCGAKKEDGRPVKYKHCHGA
jgi:preprotein translocase subunit SecA